MWKNIGGRLIFYNMLLNKLPSPLLMLLRPRYVCMYCRPIRFLLRFGRISGLLLRHKQIIYINLLSAGILYFRLSTRALRRCLIENWHPLHTPVLSYTHTHTCPSSYTCPSHTYISFLTHTRTHGPSTRAPVLPQACLPVPPPHTYIPVPLPVSN